MTNNEIIKELKTLLEFKLLYGDLQSTSIISNALDLIKRQQAEIEELKNAKVENAFILASDKIKSEAVKEFADRVKEEIKQALESNYDAKTERMKKPKIDMADEFVSYCEGKIHCLRGLDCYIDNLVKEMEAKI